MNVDADHLARARLTCLAEPDDSLLAALVDTIGPVDAIAGILDEKLPSDLAGGQALGRWRSRLGRMPDEEQVRRWLDAGIRLICPGDSEWPEQLYDLDPGRPYALWLRGTADLRLSCLKSVSIVGSRAASPYGSHMAAELSSGVSGQDWTVVSGAAFGVDGAVHSGALSAGGTTVAVLACGVDRSYPAGHKGLLDQIAGHGVIVSEWPPGRNPTRLRFLARNRIIAALTLGTVVVEAGQASGTLNAARRARDLGRTLMAVPGPVTSEQSRGCHTIIRDWGGALITSAKEIVQEMAADCLGTRIAPRSELQFGATTAVVLGTLSDRDGLSAMAVAQKAGIPPFKAQILLDSLAKLGFAEEREDGWHFRQA